MKKKLKITLLVDNPRSWIVPYARELEGLLNDRGHEVFWCEEASTIPSGDCAFFLSCEKIVPGEILARNKHNLVIHESALPEGRGWSPLTWQILEGKHDIPITLFEAVEKVDSGPIYLRDNMHFEGHELVGELREIQGRATIKLALKFIDEFPPKISQKQKGKGSFYPRRTPKDSELDPEKTIAAQFNFLRVVDNERYPTFFRHRGHAYILKIEKKSEE